MTEPATPPEMLIKAPIKRGKLEITRGGVKSTVRFQFNPESLRRQLQPKMVGGNSESKSAPLYYTGPPVETISVRLEISAAENEAELTWKDVTRYGVRPLVAAIEMAFYPKIDAIEGATKQLKAGVMEIGVFEVPLIVFDWGEFCRAPVKLTSYSVTEQQFNKSLVPVLATVDLGMQVLSAEDVSVHDPAYPIYVAYQRQKEALARSCYETTAVPETSLPEAAYRPSVGETVVSGVNEAGEVLGGLVNQLGSVLPKFP